MFAASSVEFVDWMGDDLAVVNAARVSFDKESDWRRSCFACGAHDCEADDCKAESTGLEVEELWDRDVALLHFLARGMAVSELDETVLNVMTATNLPAGEVDRDVIREQLRKYRARPLHWSPFAHVSLKLRITAPLAIARQLETHQVGLAANEVSRRYVDSDPDFLSIERWRARPASRKQGSGGPAAQSAALRGLYEEHMLACLGRYQEALDLGAAPEQARFLLPVSTMTTWVWTGSLYAFSSICRQRVDDDHAQEEVRDVCTQIAAYCEEYFPESWNALRSY